MANNTAYMSIPLRLLRLDSTDVRLSMADEEIGELASSIAEVGLLNPLTVVRDGEGYRVIAGRRRLRACRELGLAEVSCCVVEANSAEAYLIAFAENLQRKSLSVIEEANALFELITTHQMTQEEVAQRIGKSRSYVANRLRLLDCDETLASALHSAEITAGHALELIRIDAPDWRNFYLAQTIDFGFSVANLRQVVNNYTQMAALPAEPSALEGREMITSTPPQTQLLCQVCGVAHPMRLMRTLLVDEACYTQLLIA